MKQYIAIVKSEGGKVTKYLDFDTKLDADAHAVKHGGFVSPKPDDDRMDYWIVDGEKLTYDKSTADSDDAALVANAYKGVRRSSYPEIGDQMDMQYHDLVDGTTTWKDAVAKVKSDNPKP